MAGNSDEVLAYLRAIEAKLDAMRGDVAEIGNRMEALDYAVVQMESSLVVHHASLNRQFDRLDSLMDRIERRLGIPPE